MYCRFFYPFPVKPDLGNFKEEKPYGHIPSRKSPQPIRLLLTLLPQISALRIRLNSFYSRTTTVKLHRKNENSYTIKVFKKYIKRITYF
jgi:hypothetical protein